MIFLRKFRRFQEVTLVRLQEIAANYNVSYNVDASFRRLESKHEALESAANVTHGALHEELRDLKSGAKKLQNKTRKAALRVQALEDAWQERERQGAAEREAQDALLSNLTRELARRREDTRALQASQGSQRKVLESLQDALKNQGAKLAELEQLVKAPPEHNEVLLPSALAAAPLLNRSPAEKEPEAAAGQGLTLKKLRAKHRQRKKLLQLEHRRLEARAQNGSLPGQEPSPQEETEEEEAPPQSEPQGLRQERPVMDKASEEEEREVPQVSRPPGTICNVGTMLVFPNASTENFAAFRPSFHTALLELSLCSWVRTSARYLGTILSYATEDNDNKLVLHGRDAAPRNAIHFVIGDPAFRELPVGRFLDGRWHHLCVIWSSIQGRYWFYVDRRLASMGSRFQKGYEVPAGGSLVLGQEQDTLGGGFEPSEAFVGHLAGWAMWDRVLSPGEVSGIATGNGLPRGPVLSLANVTKLSGAVQKVTCSCLEHCP
ncbi:PREDICTED: pentraxin-4 isoform X2 [Gekko japonicus]|uniref:Pentraxin-4 isoform X2 n=1 Tax=Gekko japonicus TaxID=146911 RepID=A0ABM1JVD2_GEKJA|nr:PREDICTED: pentraxin-4 isoform X2 [Gekko japonicus]